MKPHNAFLVMAAFVAAVVPMRSAYPGHGDDADIKALLTAGPALRGTPADSCATCHRGGSAPGTAVAPSRTVSHCDYCHAVFVAGKGDIAGTLNRYGAAYRDAGRGPGAVRLLETRDSDGDGAANGEELRKGTNPGEAASHPSAPVAPRRTYTVPQIRALSPVVSERIFLNSTKSRSGDSYHDYRGNRLDQVLDAVGLSPSAETVDSIAADGYETTLTLQELRSGWKQGRVVPGLSKADAGPCGWVSYGPAGTDGGGLLADAHVMLAFEENGQPLEQGRLETGTGRLLGKGPLRAIVPQSLPSPPDLAQTADPACAAKVRPEHRFNEAYDHNAGRGVGAIIAIRVNPLPVGTRDVDWQTPAARSLAAGEVLFFGALK